MKIKPKLLSILFAAAFILFAVCPSGIAKTYMWEDFTKPFKEKIRVSTKVEVTVNLPASILEEYRDLPIIIEHQGLGSDQGAVWRGLLTINNQSIWKSQAFGHGNYTEEPVRISLKTENFKPGLNTLHFSLHSGATARINWYTITALSFDLPDLAKHQQPIEKKSSPVKSDKPESIPIPPAKQLPKDAAASDIVPPVRDTATRSPSVSSPEAVSRAAQFEFGKYYALVIGNNEYRNIPKLKTAVKDAKAVAKLLRDKYEFRVTLLENATRSAIFSAFSKLLRGLQVNDNLLIYYAGHGNMDRQSQRGYWLPVDAQRSNKANWVANEDITSELKAITAKHVLIVADSCYSGTLTRSLDMGAMRVGGLEEWVRRMAERRSRTVLTSGGLEPVLDAGGEGHSVFARAFLRALAKNDTIIDMDSLYETIRRQVVLNAEQTPLYSDIRFAGHDDGDFIFVPR
jgi:uncharacterized caspase-like protein